jgi:hypothetical protein
VASGEAEKVGRVDSDLQSHMKPFMKSMETSLESMLRKTSSTVISGQSVVMENLPTSASRFVHSISKMAPALLKQGSLGAINVNYEMPEVLKSDAQISSQTAISVHFGNFGHPPAITGMHPVSPIVALNLAKFDGTKVAVANLQDPVEISIPFSTDNLCPLEKRKWTRELRCRYYDPVQDTYLVDGVGTVQNQASVVCRSTHLTSLW